MLASLEGHAPGVEQAFRKSLERAEQTGDGRLVADALCLLAECQRMRGKLDEALRLAERAVPLAEGGPPGWVMRAKSQLGLALLYRGGLARSKSQLDAALGLPCSQAPCRHGRRWSISTHWSTWPGLPGAWGTPTRPCASAERRWR